MHKKRIKKSLTIIEVVIALSLFVGITTALFSIFLSTSRSEKILIRSQEKMHTDIFFQTRMKTLFSQVITKAKKGAFFSTEGASPSLVFICKDQPDIDRDFRGMVICRLLVDSGKLKLLTWPMPTTKAPPKKMKEEVLLENVKSIAYSFFGKFPKEAGGAPQWEESAIWKKDFPTNPLRIWLQITFADERQSSFWFFMPKEIQNITYHN